MFLDSILWSSAHENFFILLSGRNLSIEAGLFLAVRNIGFGLFLFVAIKRFHI